MTVVRELIDAETRRRVVAVLFDTTNLEPVDQQDYRNVQTNTQNGCGHRRQQLLRCRWCASLVQAPLTRPPT